MRPHWGRPAASDLLPSGQHGYERCGLAAATTWPALLSSCPCTVSHQGLSAGQCVSHLHDFSPRVTPVSPPLAIRPSGSVSDPPPGHVPLGEAFSSAEPLLVPSDRTPVLQPCPERWGLALREFGGPSVISCMDTWHFGHMDTRAAVARTRTLGFCSRLLLGQHLVPPATAPVWAGQRGPG